MKTIFTVSPGVKIVVITFLTLALLAPARAATYVWTGNGSNANWSTASNWTGNLAPTNNGTAVIILAGTNQLSPNVDVPWSINSLSFSNGAGTFVVGGNSLTIFTGGVTNSSANPQTITNTITLGTNQSWNAASNNLTFAGNVGNAGSNLLTVTGPFNTVIAGSLGGAGGITKTGTGTNFLIASNSYTGATTISAGVMNLQNSGALGGGSGGTVVASGAALQLQNGISVPNEPLTLSGTGITNSGALRNISGSNSWSGPITLAATTMIASDAGTLNLSSNIANSTFTTTFTNVGTIILGGALGSGSGGLTKNGTGTLIINGANSYTGLTTINTGTLQFGAMGSLPATSAVTVNAAGTLDLNSFNESILSLTGAGSVTFESGNLTVINTANVSFSGVMSGTGGFIESGTGTQTLTGLNTYGGGTTINSGVVSVKSDSYLGNTNGGITLNGGTFNSGTTLTSARAITLGVNGGIINPGTGTLTLSGPIGGVGELTKIGTKTLVLTGTNTYQGGTIDAGGTLTIYSDAGLGNATNSITLSNATLSVQATFPSARPVTLLSGTNFFLINTGFTNTWSGVIGGSAVLNKSGKGVLILTGGNTFTNTATVSAGTLQLGTNGSLSTNVLLNISSSSAIFNLAGFTQSVGGLTGPGQVMLGSGSLTAGGNNLSTNYAGIMSGTGTFTKTGTGTLTNSGASTYTGVTTVSGGTLQITANQRLSTSSPLVVSNGAVFNLANFNETIASLSGAGSVSLGSGTLTMGNSNSATFSGVISGMGGLTKVGAGTQIFAGTNTYSGATAVNLGNLQVNGVSTNSAATIASTATLSGNGSVGTVTLNSGATNAPGSTVGPGTLGSGSETWAGGGNYLWEINNATGTQGGASGWDWLNITGTLNITANAGSPFKIDLVSLTPANAAGQVTNFNNTVTYIWTIATASGGITGFATNSFNLVTGGFQNSLGAGAFSLSQLGNNLNLIFTTASLPSLKEVQSGTLTSTGNGTNTVALGIAVNPTNSFLIFNTRHNSSLPGDSMVRGRIASSNTVEFARVTPDTATINIQWYVAEYSSGVRVQRGEISETNTTLNVPLSTISATNQAFVTWSKTPELTALSFDDSEPLVGQITATTNLQFRVGSIPVITVSAPIISWQIIEFLHPAAINVQSGSITNMTGTNLQASATLATAVDPTATFVLAGYRTTGTGTSIGARLLRAQLSNSTTINFDRSISGTPDNITEIYWQAVQLMDNSLVQSGSINFPAGVTETNAPFTISLNTNRAVAFSSVQPVGGQNTGRSPSTNSVLGVGSATLLFTSNSQITLDRNNSTDQSDIGWFVLGLGPSSILVPATGGSAISADTKGGAYTSLTGPVYTELESGNTGTGTIILNAPAGFIFNTNATLPTVLITRVGGTGANSLNVNGVASGTIVALTTIKTNALTFTVTSASSSGVTCSLTWQNISVRPTLGTPLASGSITSSGTSIIQGVTTNLTSWGYLNETVGAAAKLAIATAPSSTAVAGVNFTQQPVVQIQDQFGNLLTSDNSDVITVTNNGTGLMQGTTNITVVGGVATFIDLNYQVASTIKLGFAVSGLTGVTSGNVVVNPAPANQLVIQTQPSATVTAGASFPQQPVIQIQDQFGNVLTSDNSDVITASLDQGSDILYGTLTATAVNGVATFTNLSYQVAETITIDFNSGSLNQATCNGINVNAAVASQLVIQTQPSSVAMAGVAFAQQPVIQVQDAFGNLCVTNNSTIVTALRDAGSGSGTLQGALNATASGGIASFTSLAHDVAGTISIDFNSGALTNTTSSSITINPASVAQLAFSTQPGSATVGSIFGVQPALVTQDAFGNASVSGLASSLPASLALTSGFGPLQGTTSLDIGTSAGNGAVTFSNLRIDSAGSKQLTASASGLASAVSPAFTVALGPQTITFGALPNHTYGDAPFSLSASASSGLSIAFSNVSGPASVSGSNVTILAAGTVTIAASQPGNSNYLAATPVNQSFFVSNALLTVTANNQTKIYGATNPVLTAAYTGFVNSDTTNSLTGAPSLSTTATTNSTVAGGPYPITVTQGTLSSTNYTFTFVPGSLTVTAAGSSVALGSSTNPSLPGSNVTFTVTLSPLAPASSTPTGKVQFLTNSVASGAPANLVSGVASFSIATLPHATNLITAQYLGDTNFSPSSNTLNQIINTPPVAGTANFVRPTNVTLLIRVSTLLTNATDADGDILTLRSFGTNSTNGGTISAVSTNGTFIFYQPPATNGNVTDSFTYTVADSYNATNTGNIVITILAASNGQSANITGLTTLPNGSVQIGFAGIPGRNYLVQAATNLTPIITWTTLATNVAGTNGLFQYTDTNATNFGIRYYRTAQP